MNMFVMVSAISVAARRAAARVLYQGPHDEGTPRIVAATILGAQKDHIH
jgi:hypothetical protein